MESVEQAQAFVEGADLDYETVSRLARVLREAGRYAEVSSLLVAAGRRAHYEDWEPTRRADLAKVLRDHQLFGYARRILGRLRAEGDTSELLRQQHALCTYKDAELPAARRLDRAQQILEEGGPLKNCVCPETLGLAGAVFKRRWEVDAKPADLDSALWCYRRGHQQTRARNREYAGINAAFVADRIAALQTGPRGDAARAAELRAEAKTIREEIVAAFGGGDKHWHDATLAEAHFGLGNFAEANRLLGEIAAGGKVRPWQLESTAMQLAELGRLLGFEEASVGAALQALLGEPQGALVRGSNGKVGLALSGGGFRASLFHVGVLARLAECGILRRVEVLSCVSGGSILGAFYYLKLRRMLQERSDAQIGDDDYVALVAELAEEFLAGVRKNLRGRLTTNVGDDWKMLSSRFSRTERLARLLDDLFYSKVEKEAGEGTGPWRLTDLFITPRGSGKGFSLRYDNWRRSAKVPTLVLNATTLNTGHIWQFTASWMGEPSIGVDEGVNASRRLRRVYYDDAPEEHREPRLATAVAASAAVPGLFPPITFGGLYVDENGEAIDVELVDGGVHDNQGVASLVEQDCALVLISDASGQASDVGRPARGVFGVAKRSNSVLMSRVRAAQLEDLTGRLRSGVLRGLMVVHLKKGLSAPPRDWVGCVEPYSPEDDALAPGVGSQRPAYGIDEDVQRVLADLRTDLDDFSDEEAYALMASGYAMARYEFAKAMPDEGVTGPVAMPAGGWPFAAALARLAAPDGLADELRPGRFRFLRGYRRWRLAMARKPKGRIRKLLDSTRLSSAPGAVARGGRAVVIAPARKVFSAPVALIGGVGSRIHLWASGYGGD